MTIKVNYDTETTLVKGYYPDSINYTLIPEPFIEIEDDAQVLDKQMCVIDGIYQEYVMPDSVLLAQTRKTKIAQLKLERNRLLLGAQTYTITVDGVFCTFALSNADLPNLIARQSCLGSASETSGWNDIRNNRIELNNAAFLGLIKHINANDVDVWNLYTEKLSELNNPNLTLEELNAININFN